MRFKQSQIFTQILEQFVINPKQYTWQAEDHFQVCPGELWMAPSLAGSPRSLEFTITMSRTKIMGNFGQQQDRPGWDLV